VTEEPGLNSRLDEIQAAILNVKLKDLDEDNARRQQIAQIYREGLAGLSITLPVERADTAHVYHLYVIASDARDLLKKKLFENEVSAGVHYPVPGHLYKGYGSLCRLPHIGLPVTQSTVSSILSLPIYPELLNTDIEKIISTTKHALST
jgi:dTDP-4-amino-4,6-dideoxygalactose transaminase